MDLHQAFVAAQSAVAQSSSPTSDQQKLLFYSHFKQASCGPARGSRPGMFDFRARAKWDAWAALGSMDMESAKRAYLDLADTQAPGWRPVQDHEQEHPQQAAHSDCQQSVDEGKDTGMGSRTVSTDDMEQVARSQGVQSSTVSDVEEEPSSQHHLGWRQFSGLYGKEVRGANCDAALSDRQQTADEDEDSVSTVDERHTFQQPTSWRQFSGLYRNNARGADSDMTLSDSSLPATAILTW